MIAYYGSKAKGVARDATALRLRRFDRTAAAARGRANEFVENRSDDGRQ